MSTAARRRFGPWLIQYFLDYPANDIYTDDDGGTACWKKLIPDVEEELQRANTKRILILTPKTTIVFFLGAVCTLTGL